MASRRGGPRDPASRPARKDRLIQTRVPRDLEQTLKLEARRRRLTVSHLVRNVLEDAFDLVDGVVADVDRIVSDSLGLARNAGRRARRLGTGRAGRPRHAGAARAPDTGEPGEAVREGDALAEVRAWHEVVLHRPAPCTGCGARLGRGQRAWAALDGAPGAPSAWMCPACIDALAAEAEGPDGTPEPGGAG